MDTDRFRALLVPLLVLVGFAVVGYAVFKLWSPQPIVLIGVPVVGGIVALWSMRGGSPNGLGEAQVYVERISAGDTSASPPVPDPEYAPLWNALGDLGERDRARSRNMREANEGLADS